VEGGDGSDGGGRKVFGGDDGGRVRIGAVKRKERWPEWRR